MPPRTPVAASLALAAALAACGPRSEPPAPAAPGAAREGGRVQRSGVRTAVATREPLGPIHAAARIGVDESRVVAVSAGFAGWVEEVPAGGIGQAVEPGDVLAKLYSPDAITAQQQALAVSQWTRTGAPGVVRGDGAQARDARARLERFGIAPRDVDELLASGAPDRTMKLRAPIRGFVARTAAYPGAYARAGAELFAIADLSSVWAIADVPAPEGARVRAGQRATVTVDARPGERFEGTIALVHPAVAQRTGTLQARIVLPNADLRLRPGMTGDARVEADAATAIVVPAEAVVDSGEARWVFVDRGEGRLEPRQVTVGATDGGRTAIRSGVAEGERVVTTARFLVDSESDVRAALEAFRREGAGR